MPCSVGADGRWAARGKEIAHSHHEAPNTSSNARPLAASGKDRGQAGGWSQALFSPKGSLVEGGAPGRPEDRASDLGWVAYSVLSVLAAK